MISNKDIVVATPYNNETDYKDLNMNCVNAPRPCCSNHLGAEDINEYSDEYNDNVNKLSRPPRLSLSPKPLTCKKINHRVSFDIYSDCVEGSSGKGSVTSFSKNSWYTGYPMPIENSSNNPVSPRHSNIKCRICLEMSTDDDYLVSPCKCKGSVGLMHSSCLRYWIKSCGQEFCEICKCRYNMEKRTPPCCTWMRELRTQRFFIADVICLCFLVPFTTIAVYFCIHAAIFVMADESERTISDSRWKGIGLILLAIMLVFCLTVWVGFTIKHYYCLFREFQGVEYRWSIHDRKKTIIHATATSL